MWTHLKNLNHVAHPPKNSSNQAPAHISKHWIQFQVEPTMFEPLLKIWDAVEILPNA